MGNSCNLYYSCLKVYIPPPRYRISPSMHLLSKHFKIRSPRLPADLRATDTLVVSSFICSDKRTKGNPRKTDTEIGPNKCYVFLFISCFILFFHSFVSSRAAATNWNPINTWLTISECYGHYVYVHMSAQPTMPLFFTGSWLVGWWGTLCLLMALHFILFVRHFKGPCYVLGKLEKN